MIDTRCAKRDDVGSTQLFFSRYVRSLEAAYLLWCRSMPHDIFISYVEEDGDIASQVCDVLESVGIRCWIAPRNIAPGRTWGAAIIEAITVCRVMVLVFSSRTNLSRQVARELERADNKGIRVVPFRIEDVPPSGDLEYFLGSIQWFDAFEGRLEAHLRRLTETLQTLLQEIGNATRPDTEDRERKDFSKVRLEQRILDAALSKRVPVEKPTELLAMFRCVDSEGLKAILQVDDDYSVDQEDVRSEAFELDFPRASDGQLLPAELILKVDSPEFEPKSQQKKVRVPPKGDSETYIFLLTPKHLGKLVVNLEVCKRDLAITSRFLTTTVEPSERGVPSPAKVLVSIPFYVVGYAPAALPQPIPRMPSGVPIPESRPPRAAPATPRDKHVGQTSDQTAFGAGSPTPTHAPPRAAATGPAAPASRRARFWIGGLSTVAALFICGILVLWQLRQNSERVETSPSGGSHPTGVDPSRPAPIPGTGGRPRPTPEIQPPTLPAAESRTLSFVTGSVDSTGRVTRRTSAESAGRIEKLAGRVSLTMVEIPAGRVLMGSSARQLRSLRSEYSRHGASAAEVGNVLRREMPQHVVHQQNFLIGRTEVTQAQWAVVASWEPVGGRLRENPSETRGAELPVTNVSWRDAEEFCKRLSAKTKQTYRLPSEAEWEYACRAGTAGPFNLGPAISPAVANYHSRFPFGEVSPEGERGRPIAAGQLRLANAFGLYDMHGNVWEWCADFWHADYSGAPSDGRVWINGGDDSLRPVRGGGWNDIAFFARSSLRAPQPLDKTSPWIGFRVVLQPTR
jgi:formylglycine-generating enzyme required for sulfatase activity